MYGDPEVEPEDEEKMLEKQLAEASRQAHLAALCEKITCEHQHHLETKARIRNYQNNVNKQPRSGSHSEPTGETSQPMGTMQDGIMDNQPDSSTTARIPDNDNTSQSSENDHNPQDTPVQEPVSSTVKDNTIALGRRSGRVAIIMFSVI